MCLRWQQWWWQEGKRRPCFSSIVAHGKVCMGDRTLSELRPCTHLGWWLLSAESLHSMIFGWQRQMLVACHSKMTSSNLLLWFNELSSNVSKQNQPQCSLNFRVWAKSDFSLVTASPYFHYIMCFRLCDVCHLAFTLSLHSQERKNPLQSMPLISPDSDLNDKSCRFFRKHASRRETWVKTHHSQSNFRKTDLIASKFTKREHRRHHHPSSYPNKEINESVIWVTGLYPQCIVGQMDWWFVDVPKGCGNMKGSLGWVHVA